MKPKPVITYKRINKKYQYAYTLHTAAIIETSTGQPTSIGAAFPNIVKSRLDWDHYPLDGYFHFIFVVLLGFDERVYDPKQNKIFYRSHYD